MSKSNCTKSNCTNINNHSGYVSKDNRDVHITTMDGKGLIVTCILCYAIILLVMTIMFGFIEYQIVNLK